MEGQKTVWPIIKGYKFRILLLKTFVYVFVLVTVPLLLVLSLNYNKYNAQISTRVMDMNDGLLQKNAAVSDNVITGLLDTANKASQLNSVVDVVAIKDKGENYDEKVAKALSEIKNYTMSNDLILATFVYSDVNDVLINENGATRIQPLLELGKWYDVYKNTKPVQPYILVNNANSVYVCQPIWAFIGQKVVGVLVLEIEF